MPAKAKGLCGRSFSFGGLSAGMSKRGLSGCIKPASALAAGFFVFFLFNASLGISEEVPLIDVEKKIPEIVLDIRYASKNNFMEQQLYPEPRCLLRKETADKLLRVQKRLLDDKLSLKIFDGYRPLAVQKLMWERVPVEGYVANPAKGSNHNRGAAVDVTLVDETGRELPMPSAYDEFSERAHRAYEGGTDEERKNRQLLQDAMEREGFVGLKSEWWHFDDVDAKQYPVLDLPFSAVAVSSES